MNISTITLKTIKKQFNHGTKSLTVFEDVSLHLQKGHTYALTGVSGAGKSTLLHIIAGLEPLTEGELYFDTTSYDQFSSYERNVLKNRCLGLVFQMPYLIDELSILENVMLKGLIGGLSSKECEKMAQTLLFRVGLSEKKDSFPSELSGGQQQRVAIARALLHKPDFLFADEPTGNLDEHTAQEIVELLISCAQQWSMGLFISTHNMQLADRMQTVFRLEKGTIKKGP